MYEFKNAAGLVMEIMFEVYCS